jgi:tetratricopeptide (TPR) repeat protein
MLGLSGTLIALIGLAMLSAGGVYIAKLSEQGDAFSAPTQVAGLPGGDAIAGGDVNSIDLAAAFKSRGGAYDDLGHYDSAIDDYGHTIAINPADGDAFNDRGIVPA